jgi:hypothetical protein
MTAVAERIDVAIYHVRHSERHVLQVPVIRRRDNECPTWTQCLIRAGDQGFGIVDMFDDFGAEHDVERLLAEPG